MLGSSARWRRTGAGADSLPGRANLGGIMAENAYVYVLYDAQERVRYVGIGNRQRPYETHNDDYDEARALSSDVRITSIPFSTRRDAELTEALLIRVLADAEMHGVALTNRSGTVATSDLVPLVAQREGALKYSDLRHSILVKVSPKRIDEVRDVVSGVTSDADAAERCRKWWGIASVVGRGDDIRQLVAISTSDVKPRRVLGIWETKPVVEWDVDGMAIELVDASSGDVGGQRGKTFDWDGYNPQNIGYSLDVRSGWSRSSK